MVHLFYKVAGATPATRTRPRKDHEVTATRTTAHTPATASTAAHSLAAAFAGRSAVPAVLTDKLVVPRPAEAKKTRKPAAEGTTTRTRKVAELHRCRCSQLVREDGDWTGCESLVKGTYAPGHDAKLASLLVAAGQAGEEVWDEAAGVWLAPEQAVPADTKLGQKVRARLGDAKAVARQNAEVLADKTRVTGDETESTDAELAKKPARVAKVTQHRREGAYAGRTTETSDVADLAWDELAHPADQLVGA